MLDTPSKDPLHPLDPLDPLAESSYIYYIPRRAHATPAVTSYRTILDSL